MSASTEGVSEQKKHVRVIIPIFWADPWLNDAGEKVVVGYVITFVKNRLTSIGRPDTCFFPPIEVSAKFNSRGRALRKVAYATSAAGTYGR